ncbi:ATP-binding protein [Niameybacter massiliensis]|uniref:ATP-binding protein n=1 Tax=Holtiella tumoricola TaxID=3018743 RepID=A0AA42DNT6_9FIRM|nr:ATP-binding protein [Holtiella tumoricola]MDA3732757.1 ATP-binding protein [Holtiella tumoricola]
MTTKELQYKLLLKQYDQKRTRAAEAKRNREEEIYKKIPDIERIDQSLNKLGISLVKSALNASPDEFIENYRHKNEELRRLKKQLLVEYGYPVDYLDMHHDCPVCKDTGFISDVSHRDSIANEYAHHQPCKCFKQALINLSYDQSNLKSIGADQSFSNFNFNYYSDQVDKEYNKSPRKNMELIYQECINFVEQFAYKRNNMLLHGPTGLGKTFLCNCIAKELLNQGYSVLYLSAQELFKLFEESRFHREDMEEDEKNNLDILLTVDLLIIDDFATEATNSFTGPDLFHVINTRALNKTSTIISTNLPLSDWRSLYSERIISRIFGEYSILRFFGEDIRLLKKWNQKAATRK